MPNSSQSIPSIFSRRSLTEIANFYGTDKGTIGPNARRVVHNYTDIYSAYLEGYRDSALRVLEIGLGVIGDRWKSGLVSGHNTGGASLKMWHDYFPRATIYGIDVNECSYLDNERIKTFVADQGNVADLDAFMAAVSGVEFDVIIDDGSHLPHHQQVSLSYFFRTLKPGGYYFIEDLRSNGLRGDQTRGVSAVKDTRRVLKHYLNHGEFEEPNALTDQQYLRDHIDYLAFHSAAPSMRVALRASLRRPLRRRVYYKPGRERLCLIRKKTQAAGG